MIVPYANSVISGYQYEYSLGTVSSLCPQYVDACIGHNQILHDPAVLAQVVSLLSRGAGSSGGTSTGGTSAPPAAPTPRPSGAAPTPDAELDLYWSAARGDNFTTATAQGRSDAQAAGYAFVRVEGYGFSTQQPGTAPLNLWYSDQRQDNFSTATAQGAADAQAAGHSPR